MDTVLIISDPVFNDFESIEEILFTKNFNRIFFYSGREDNKLYEEYKDYSPLKDKLKLLSGDDKINIENIKKVFLLLTKKDDNDTFASLNKELNNIPLENFPIERIISAFKKPKFLHFKLNKKTNSQKLSTRMGGENKRQKKVHNRFKKMKNKKQKSNTIKREKSKELELECLEL